MTSIVAVEVIVRITPLSLLEHSPRRSFRKASVGPRNIALRISATPKTKKPALPQTDDQANQRSFALRPITKGLHYVGKAADIIAMGVMAVVLIPLWVPLRIFEAATAD